MKKIRINPIMSVTGDTGATGATAEQSIYLPTIDGSRPVKATLHASGTWNSATLAVKFEDAADDSTYADVTGGGFTNVTADTAAAGQEITFTLGSTPMVNTGVHNYGKYIRCNWNTTGGTASDIDFYVILDDVYVPDDDIELRLEPEPIP